MYLRHTVPPTAWGNNGFLYKVVVRVTGASVHNLVNTSRPLARLHKGSLYSWVCTSVRFYKVGPGRGKATAASPLAVYRLNRDCDIGVYFNCPRAGETGWRVEDFKISLLIRFFPEVASCKVQGLGVAAFNSEARCL